MNQGKSLLAMPRKVCSHAISVKSESLQFFQRKAGLKIHLLSRKIMLLTLMMFFCASLNSSLLPFLVTHRCCSARGFVPWLFYWCWAAWAAKKSPQNAFLWVRFRSIWDKWHKNYSDNSISVLSAVDLFVVFNQKPDRQSFIVQYNLYRIYIFVFYSRFPTVSHKQLRPNDGTCSSNTSSG